MIVSRCCQDIVSVESDHFICEGCGKPCHTICSLILERDDNEDYYDF